MLTGLAVCGTPRSGSSYVCDLLREAHLGDPDEWLSPVLDHWRKRDFQTVEELWERHSINDVFSIKLHWAHREQTLLVADFDAALPPFSHWIFLRRQDVRAQALSWMTAVERDQWTNSSRPYVEGDPTLFERRIQRQEGDWSSWFARHGIRPLLVYAEDVFANSVLWRDRICDFVLRSEVAA